MLPEYQESSTCCEPGPLYWYMTTGYRFCAEKSAGRTMYPLSSTPSEVLKVKNSGLARLRVASLDFRVALSSRVFSGALPPTAFSVVTGGVVMLE